MVVNDLNPFWTSIAQAATHHGRVRRDPSTERHPLWLFSTPNAKHSTNRVGLGPAHSTTGILAITARIPWHSKSIAHFVTQMDLLLSGYRTFRVAGRVTFWLSGTGKSVF